MSKYQPLTSPVYRAISLLILMASAQFIFCKCLQEQAETKPADTAMPDTAAIAPDEYEGLANYDMSSGEKAQYAKEIHALRADTDKFFRSDKTPVAPEIFNLFSKLSYFPPNIDYIVNSVLKEFEDKDTVELLTSKGKIRKMIRAGEFLFKINGSKQKLTAYFAIGSEQNSFFVPFADKTNRLSTYKGGRYLDIDKEDGQYYVIDFNRAYNPYCVYNDKYSCPIVPDENKITEEIKAGEKDFIVTIKM